MYRSFGDGRRSPVWDRGEFVAFEDIRISPAAAFLSYGIGVFEGLKAQRTQDGRILLFRPDANAERFQRSAERLLMAPFPKDQFVSAVKELVRRNERFMPPPEHGSLYIRPMQHAVEPKLGLGPCDVFSVLMFSSPVGPYFRGADPRGLRLKVLEQGRCAPGGTGFAKAMGNYAGAISVAQPWKAEKFDDVLYLDARHERYLTETSGSNPFVLLRSGKLVTPPLDDQILPGVTRDSTLRVARDLLRLPVEERRVSIDEVIEEGEEFFCTGTAWTLLSVREIVYRSTAKAFPREEARKALLEVIRGIKTGERDDPFGWTVSVES
jgi:branched-chain amino acid aminotransferase